MADKKAIGGLVKLIANLGVDYIEPRLEKALKDGSLTEKLANDQNKFSNKITGCYQLELQQLRTK